MVRSPNFKKMARKYLDRGDIQDFVKQMAMSPTVLSSDGPFMQDDHISSAVRNLGLGGAGGAGGPGRSGGRRRLRDNPALKRYLDGPGAPPVSPLEGR